MSAACKPAAWRSAPRNRTSPTAFSVSDWLVTVAFGYAFERVIVLTVYGQHLKQILITMGGLIVVQQLIIVIWGPVQITLPVPGAFRGSLIFGEVAIERYRLIAVMIGLIVFV